MYVAFVEAYRASASASSTSEALLSLCLSLASSRVVSAEDLVFCVTIIFSSENSRSRYSFLISDII